MQRCEKNEATLGYRMPKMHQAPVAVHRAMRIAEKKHLGGGFNQSEKHARQIGHLPQVGVKIKTFLKPPPRLETSPISK